MTWTTPFTAIAGLAITASGWNTSGRDNLLHLRALLADPSAANLLLVTTSASAAAFSTPSGDAVFTPGSMTGNAAGSAIGTGAIHANRLVAGTFDAAAVAAAFAAGAIAQEILAVAVQNKLIFAGLIGMVRTASEVPAGWTTESNLAGRIPVGAGTTFGVTYTEDTAYGTSWSHDHTMGGHTHGVSGTLPATGSAANNVEGDDNDWPTAAQSHTHTFSATSAGDSTTSSATSWVVPSRAYVYVRKD